MFYICIESQQIQIMKTSYLFPHRFKKLGWIILLPGLVLGMLVISSNFELDWLQLSVPSLLNETVMGSTQWFTWTEQNLTDELATVLIIAGLMLVSFSKERNEDEFISRIRLESLVWATHTNYIVLLLSALFIYGTTFFLAMTFNMFTILGFFTIRFHWALHNSKKMIGHEK